MYMAVLTFLAVIAAACGNVVTETEASTSAAPIAAQPFDEVQVEYGATLDEWADATSDSGESLTSRETSSDFSEIEWEDLVPAGYSHEEVWARYDDRLADVEYGSPEETALYEQMQSEIDNDIVEPALDGQKIRLEGFVAPLTYDGDIVTEFLLVPYFGACIHVPAPPANQTVMVTLDKANGFTIDEAWGAVWVEGVMTIDANTTELGATGYTIDGQSSGVYEGF